MKTIAPWPLLALSLTLGCPPKEDTGTPEGDADTDADTDTGTPEDHDGRWKGPFQMDGSALGGFISDSCVGEVDLEVDSTLPTVIKGQGCCQFTGVLLDEPFFLTDTYCGDIVGDIVSDPDAAGTVIADISITILKDDWEGTFDAETFTGAFDGTQTIDFHGTPVDLTYAGFWTATLQP